MLEKSSTDSELENKMRARKRTKAPTEEVRVQRNAGKRVVEDAIETVSIPTITDGTQVEVSLGRTINTGNYSSLRFSVTVTLPCLSNELNAAYVRASMWAAGKADELSLKLGAAAPDAISEALRQIELAPVALKKHRRVMAL